MGNNYVIFLHIQIEYLKCKFWELKSPQNNLWFIFNKCLKLEKVTALLFLLYVICKDSEVETNFVG